MPARGREPGRGRVYAAHVPALTSPEFGADSTTVGAARQWVSAAAAELGVAQLDWPLTLLASELATNAVLHAHTGYTLHLATVASGVRLEIRDLSPRLVRQRLYSPEATTGRGMLLVEAMSRAWGVQQRPTGKTVWVELDLEPAGAAADALLDAFDEGGRVAP